MASNTYNLNTWAAKRIIGDNTSQNPAGALLNSGSGRADNSTTGDTWIFLDTIGGTTSPWGFKHAQGANNIEFFGGGTKRAVIHLGSDAITTAHLIGGADTWYTARTLTIGNTGKSVNGSANVSWTATEILGSSDSTKFYRGDKVWSDTLTGPLNMSGTTAAITWTASTNTTPTTSTPMAISYGRLQCYGTLNINANTDNSGTEYVILTAGKGMSSTTTDGLYVGTSTMGFQSVMKIVDGCLSLFPTTGSYREGLRIHSYSSWSDITLCGNDNTGDSGTSANSWFIGNNNGNFYLTRNGSSSGTSLFGCVSNIWRLYTSADMPEGAANIATANAGAHYMTFYRNAILIPYQMDNVNDGGFFRVRGASESACIAEIGTWDDSGAGETIQFNYYPTTSQITPTYSISVPKASGTIALVGHTHSMSNITWTAPQNCTCVSTANNQEWSFDMNNQHTGCYWHVWSAKNSASCLQCFNDDRHSWAYKLYGAVWNDYAEFRCAEEVEYGRVVIEDKDGQMKLCNTRLAAGAKISSDTFGISIGKSDKYNMPIAVSGRVLAFPYQERDKYELGAAVCSAPNGTVDIMTREEIMMYPERILGTVSEIPDYDIWYAGGKNEQGGRRPRTSQGANLDLRQIIFESFDLRLKEVS